MIRINSEFWENLNNLRDCSEKLTTVLKKDKLTFPDDLDYIESNEDITNFTKWWSNLDAIVSDIYDLNEQLGVMQLMKKRLEEIENEKIPDIGFQGYNIGE